MTDFENKRVDAGRYLGDQIPTRGDYRRRRRNNKNRHLRLKVIARDGLNCCWCGKTCDPNSKPGSDLHPTLEHVTPTSMGGRHCLANCKLACRKCNTSHVGIKKMGLVSPGWDNGLTNKVVDTPKANELRLV